jgi:desulfoferrodoxin-like iron-binding protein
MKMAEKLEIYKCEVCGNIVEVLHGGKGELVSLMGLKLRLEI